jgi:hypothetical protein
MNSEGIVVNWNMVMKIRSNQTISLWCKLMEAMVSDGKLTYTPKSERLLDTIGLFHELEALGLVKIGKYSGRIMVNPEAVHLATMVAPELGEAITFFDYGDF